MNKALLLAGIATCLFTANANAVELKQYVSGKVAYSDVAVKDKWTFDAVDDFDETSKDKMGDTVWGGSLAYGVKAYAVRAELEFNLYQDAEKKIHKEDYVEKHSVENNSVMFNAYYDIDTGTRFTPYVGAGIGMARLKYKYSDTDGDKRNKAGNKIAWQIGAGVSYAATENVAIDAGYRYVDKGALTVEKGADQWESWKEKIDMTSNEFYLGARYMF